MLKAFLIFKDEREIPFLSLAFKAGSPCKDLRCDPGTVGNLQRTREDTGHLYTRDKEHCFLKIRLIVETKHQES